MTNQDFAFVADALLALCEREREAPFYSNEEFRLKELVASRRDRFAGHLGLAEESDFLFQEECRAVFDNAKLTERQAEVLTQRLEGCTFEQIGKESGHSKQNAQSVFILAIKKLSRSFHVYRYRGLSEVYRGETQRGVRRCGFGRMFRRA